MEEDKRKNRTEDDKIGDDVEDVESSALTVKGMAFGGGVGEVKRRIGGGGGGDGDGGSSGGGGGGGGGGDGGSGGGGGGGDGVGGGSGPLYGLGYSWWSGDGVLVGEWCTATKGGEEEKVRHTFELSNIENYYLEFREPACCGLAKSLRAKEIGSVPTMLSEKYVLQVIWKQSNNWVTAVVGFASSKVGPLPSSDNDVGSFGSGWVCRVRSYLGPKRSDYGRDVPGR
ncbi:hypothetical protein HZH68_007733 [Vespula germanica]|uniref:Uncharacterized protein n=1 Tax=Vespula germanica TaxID=30212 RepID=A0A834K348_VESGE|nr:hypothetical protein HZH68_007733 [Vespula germanica]